MRESRRVSAWAAMVALAACHARSPAGGDAGALADAASPDAAATDAAVDAGPCAAVFAGVDPCASPDVGAPGLGSSAVVCDVTSASYGAVANGTDQTRALQAAIDDCGAVGRFGKVIVPAGTFVTGTLTLHGNMTLHLDAGATLSGIVPASAAQDAIEYPTPTPAVAPNNSNTKECGRGLIFATGVDNLTIEADAGGTILGNGDATFWAKDMPNTVDAGVVDYDRPIALWIANSQHVTIAGVTIKHAAMWSFVNMEDTDVRIAGVTVDSPDQNERDGLDIVDSHHVCVTASSVSSEDDSICLKSGSITGVDDVHITGCTAHGDNPPSGTSEGNGLKLGTASYGAFTHVCFDHIAVSGYKQAAIAVESIDGADIASVLFSNIVLDTVQAPFFVLLGNRYTLPTGGALNPGSIDGVTFQHIAGRNVISPWGSAIAGTQIGSGATATTLIVHDIAFIDVALQLLGAGAGTAVPTNPPEYDGSGSNNYPEPAVFGALPAWAFWSRHADHVTFTDLDAGVAGSDNRPEIDIE